MSRVILLDSGPLGLVSNPNPSHDAEASRQWVKDILSRGDRVLVSEVAGYEVRRELIRVGKSQGIARLDLLKTSLGYAVINTATMLKAAELWALARKIGLPTAHNLSLDADMIIAAQAALMIEAGRDCIVATPNVKHFNPFVPAAPWQQIQ